MYVEEALLLAFLTLLPFHLVLKKLLPSPVGTYWKEAVIAILLLGWVVRCLHSRSLVRPGGTLDLAVLLFLALVLVHFVVDRDWQVKAWGLYKGVMYLPLYFVVGPILQRRERLRKYIWAVLTVSVLVSLGGILEYVLDTTLWPSEEMFSMHGFYGVYIYATRIRRVYFTFDSPTTLANYLGLMIPLAVALIPATKTRLRRILLFGASLLLLLCLLVTFSRGLWVATFVALVVMALLSRRAIPARYLRYIGASLLAFAALWVAIVLLNPFGGHETDENVLELLSDDFRSVSLGSIVFDFVDSQPVERQQEGAADSSLVEVWTIEGDTRTVLFEHPPQKDQARLSYRVQIPSHAALKFGVALAPEVWSPTKGDGVTFQVYLENDEGGSFVFVRYLNPKSNLTDRRWRNFFVDLSPYSGKEMSLSFITESGPRQDYSYDWAGWAEPQLVIVPDEFFASLPAENAIVAYTSSIVNWRTDETNWDRIQSWQRSLAAFRQSPLWGIGLGRSGEASLRTMPEQGFVTESQVLKALVEMGLIGLIVFMILWYAVFRTAYRVYRQTESTYYKALLLGILGSFIVIFLNGLTFQNLEVKQVNAYFWFYLGVVAFLDAAPEDELEEAVSRAQLPDG